MYLSLFLNDIFRILLPAVENSSNDSCLQMVHLRHIFYTKHSPYYKSVHFYYSDAGLSSEAVKRINHAVDLSEIPEDDNGLYYKDEPYTPHKLHQRLLVTYSPLWQPPCP